MKKLIFLFLLLPLTVTGQNIASLKFVDARELMLINKGFSDTELYYSRLPKNLKGNVRQAVWDLGLNSAGIAVRFATNSKCIGAKWTLLNDFHMSHMPGTGIRGIDLYTLDNGEWKFIGVAKPTKKESQNIFIRNMDGTMHEYLAYLPLYDGVEQLAFGIDSMAVIQKPQAADLTITDKKPIVFYGTSITQGGCASRPGMVYSSIIGRKLNCETINLGFSGNARMDFVMSQTIATIDASKYVIDCLPNCTAQILKDSAYRFLQNLVQAHPKTPVYMVENIYFPHFLRDKKSATDVAEKHQVWKEVYTKLKKEGYKNVHYIKSDGLIGNDYEATVDAVHLTDLGFMRLANGLLKHIKQ